MENSVQDKLTFIFKINDKEYINTEPLDERFTHHPTPIGLHINLYEHQKTILSAMIQLENANLLYHNNNQCTRTNAGILSEKLGSGKTIIILALIIQKNRVCNRPISYINFKANNSVNKNRILIEKKFPEKRILTPSLIFVASSILLQWESAINKYTDLKVLTVSNVYGLKNLYSNIKNNDINNYDIVLVKNKNITGSFTIDGYVENKNKNKIRKIFNLIANITREYCWNRLIIDDYDVIGIPRVSGMINALFTWFISTTKSYNNSSTVIHNDSFKLVNEYLHYHNLDNKYFDINNNLYKLYNIRNSFSYVEQSISIGKPKFWSYILTNPHKTIIKLIGGIVGGDSSELIEMLNGDAINTAAIRAGIKSDNIISNVTDIFKQLLNAQYSKYILSVNTLNFINTLDINGFGKLPTPGIDDIYHQTHVYEQKPIKYNYLNIKNKILNVQTICLENKESIGKTIERVKENVKDGDCPICMEGLNNGDNTIILRCCGKILCVRCGIRGTYMSKHNKGRCPNCRQNISMDDLIFINGQFNLDTIIDEKFEFDDTDIKKETQHTKFEILLKIINGDEIEFKKRKTTIIPGLLSGTVDLQDAPPQYRKTIIFSNFDESLNKLEELMKGIKYKRLIGSAEQLHSISNEFQESYSGVNVLLINGVKFSSGRNLQSATDLIFMHKVRNKNIESQIIGRIQRIGRGYTANIHYILYSDEQ
jgi:hypothetical protein